METPNLTHTNFALLALLADGREHRSTELQAQMEGHHASTVRSCLQRMRVSGLVEEDEVIAWDPSEPNKVQKLRMVWITDEGRRTFQESLDWYLHLAQNSQESGNGEAEIGDELQILKREPVPPAVESLERKREKDRERDKRRRAAAKA